LRRPKLPTRGGSVPGEEEKVSETTCFSLLGSHHQVYSVGSKRLIINLMMASE